MSIFEQVDKTRCPVTAEADWRALVTVLASTTIRLTPTGRQELVQLAVEARSWIPAERLEAIDSARLKRASGL